MQHTAQFKLQSKKDSQTFTVYQIKDIQFGVL